MALFRRSGFTFAVFALLALAALTAGCRLQYSGEEFSLKIYAGGAGELSIKYKNFGSAEQDSALRRRDLEILKNAAGEDETLRNAREKGVEIIERRLDFLEYSMGGYVRARAGSYRDFFKVFTHYNIEVDDRLYITPMNGTVKRAVLSDGGEIVIRNDRYSFAWPLGTREISFEASYSVDGVPFSRELAQGG